MPENSFQPLWKWRKRFQGNGLLQRKISFEHISLTAYCIYLPAFLSISSSVLSLRGIQLGLSNLSIKSIKLLWSTLHVPTALPSHRPAGDGVPQPPRPTRNHHAPPSYALAPHCLTSRRFVTNRYHLGLSHTREIPGFFQEKKKKRFQLCYHGYPVFPTWLARHRFTVE